MRPQTDTQTDTQTRVTTIHFASSTTHAKCNDHSSSYKERTIITNYYTISGVYSTLLSHATQAGNADRDEGTARPAQDLRSASRAWPGGQEQR